MLQLSREYKPTHFVKPYYSDGYGSRSIGEPDWRPHPRNALSDPNTLPNTKMGSSVQDWPSIRLTPQLRPVRTQTRRLSDTIETVKAVDPPPRTQPFSSQENKRSVVKEQELSNSYEDERCIYRRPMELTLSKAMGIKKRGYCPRNGLPVIAMGDKSYQIPEYSREFHKHGSTRPTVSFGGLTRCIPDTFVPLQDLPLRPRQTFRAKLRKIQKEQEIQEVLSLDTWKPAPILASSLHLPLPVSHF
ncbi:spermatogenesis-associated serine-rich protein 1 [Exaiptasia diaphana]|uniref:Uncharacterized protein n=1 Tax=Exaiptasia diaphana TaxID=2652724 RepID=A0A913XYG5_EXADI|nr:spermatogenesis-associated serine-rich protein 1 [Exaiptasia diaphana]KXJ23752.1 Spermatogenesis-associated serine-rich protein 1 [Exaiptasia diaphana]